MKKRHASYKEIAKNVVANGFGWPDREESLSNLFSDPPRRVDTNPDAIQQTILLTGILDAALTIAKVTEGVRHAIDRLPAKIETARLAAQVNLAKQEAKAAKARERAAKSELEATRAETPVMYQCDKSDLEWLQRNGRIRNWF